MAIVPKNTAIPVKFNLPDALVQELHRYAEWAQTTRSKTVVYALKRLFEQDTDWAKNKQDNPAWNL